MPALDSPGNDSSLRDMLELISKRLENLENKRYFSIPNFEQNVRRNADIEIYTSAVIVARAAENAEAASKSATAAAAACKSVIAESRKFSASKKKKLANTPQIEMMHSSQLLQLLPALQHQNALGHIMRLNLPKNILI